MKNKISAIISLVLFPSRLKNFILSSLGWKIGQNVRIGFSYILSKKIIIKKNVSIGHGNYISINNSIKLDENSYLKHMNYITGPLDIILHEKAAIGNLNRIICPPKPISWGESKLEIGILSKVTSRHYLDCIRPITFGNYSILAGNKSQMWTHGFMHAPDGPGRYRVDGEIFIGDNVYIGTNSIINPGIKISSKVTIGSGSSVSKNINEPGLYTNQPLRKIEFDYNEGLKKYPSVDVPPEIGTVVHKKIK
tara:strand:+ start:913 stop:1662 length:750 start_codon:yes stop_codon:yes gene_type:complete